MVKKKKAAKSKRKENKRQSVMRTQEVVIKVQPMAPAPTMTAKDIEEPIKEGSKYMIPKTWLSDKQVLRIVGVTPPKHVYHRPAKGGGEWAYVTHNYIVKVLNYTFGWNWDFEIVAHGKEGEKMNEQIWVHGRLTVKSPKGETIVKSQFGRADVKYKTEYKNKVKTPTDKMLDFGNDLKAASSDALKKCASLLGIASDIYGKAEVKEETGQDVVQIAPPPIRRQEAPAETKKVTLKPGQILGPDNEPTYVCSVTGQPISDQEYEYSMKVFKRALSREAQEEYKKKR